jgi:5-formyltetrahydrofolate cyclo-ligase
VIVSGADSTPAKDALRTRLLAARRARSASDLAVARAAVAARALSLAAGHRCVAAYQPLRTEPGSVELLRGLVAAGVRVIVPVLLPDRDLTWTLWLTDSQLGPSEIAVASLILVPALAVDRLGNRLGRGGGSYDRALTRVPSATVVLGVVFDDEVLPSVPIDAWDRPVTGALTPSGVVILPE